MNIKSKTMTSSMRETQRSWTSAKRIGGFEFCGILNDALRRDDPSDLVYAIVVVRGINAITNASALGRSTDSKKGLGASRKGAIQTQLTQTQA